MNDEQLQRDAAAFNEIYDIVHDFLLRGTSELARCANRYRTEAEVLQAIYEVCKRADEAETLG